MIHVDSVHLQTDAPLGEARAHTLTHTVVSEINTALQAAGKSTPRVHIGELHLNLPQSALNNRQALAGYARSLAQQILERGDV